MARKREPKWLQAARLDGDRGPAPGGRRLWLSRALARAGLMPLAEAEAAIRAGRVALQGRIARHPLTGVWPGDEVRVDGRPVRLTAETIVLAYNKPTDAIVARTDPQGRRTVFDCLLPKLTADLRGYGWHAVGRLDRNTTGLLLFTNDENLVAHVTLPRTHVPKRYVAKVAGRLDAAKLEAMRRGMELHDGPTRPAKAVARGPDEVELTISEGRHHQVRRMLGAVGLPVTALRREAIGGIVVDVGEGEWRRLTDEEIREGLGYPPPLPSDGKGTKEG